MDNPVVFGSESDSFICQGHPCCGYAVNRRALNSQEVILVLFSFCFYESGWGSCSKTAFHDVADGFPIKWHLRKEHKRHITSQIWVVLLIGWKFASSNQTPYPDLGSHVSSVWNLCACFSDIISRGNQSCHHKNFSCFPLALTDSHVCVGCHLTPEARKGFMQQLRFLKD